VATYLDDARVQAVCADVELGLLAPVVELLGVQQVGQLRLPVRTPLHHTPHTSHIRSRIQWTDNISHRVSQICSLSNRDRVVHAVYLGVLLSSLQVIESDALGLVGHAVC
jgi:hypothetical protein